MTPAEVLALRIQAGDDDAEAQIVAEHAPLAYKLGLRWRHAFDDERDWRQVCLLGLLTAARNWNPARGRLSTWVSFWVRGEIGLAGRRNRWFSGTNAHHRPRPFSLDAPMEGDEDRRTLAELLFDPRPINIDDAKIDRAWQRRAAEKRALRKAGGLAREIAVGAAR